MKKLAYIVAAILLSAVVLHAQQSDEAPFAAFEREVKSASHRWSGDKESLSKMFDDERRRLGARFETELLKWIGDDPERHYWISFFLESESYLHGNKRLPELSLLIKQQGLALLHGRSDEESRGYAVGLSMTAAILSDELGLSHLASVNKTMAEGLLSTDPSLRGFSPAVSAEERRRYDEIVPIVRRGVTTVLGASPSLSIGDSTNPLRRAPISGGVLNGKALKLAKPRYPQAARDSGASGTVVVQVLIDETGKVISARAIGGHPDLRKVSEDAALESEFSPTRLEGKPVKVTGVIQYNFVRSRF